MTYQQIECLVQSADALERVKLLVWVEAYRCHQGDRVTFKETGDIEWDVIEVYDTVVDQHNRGWGLNLPKSQRTEA
jgi:hypothetical protein